MRSTTGSVLETLRRTQSFLDAHASLLDEVNRSSSRRNLDDVAAKLATHAVTQDGSARGSTGETAKQRTLRLALRFNHMRPIAVVAKQGLRDVPEFAALRMPRSNVVGQKLMAAAGGMADAAERHAEALIEGGVPEGFMEKFRAAATALERSLSGRDVHRRTRIGSTAGLSQEEKRGRSILKVLDSFVRPMLGSDDGLLAEWKAAKAINRKPGPAIGSIAAAKEEPLETPPA